MEERKLKEKEYHNRKRDEELRATEHSDYMNYQIKWYSIVRKSTECWETWLKANCPNKQVLDYGSGNGDSTFKMIEYGAHSVSGIDISDTSVENAKAKATEKGLSDNTVFHVMDAENMAFENNSFDLIYESGVLHHLDLANAYPELARVLRSNGKVICTEALGHNPLIRWYRRRTPNLRTEWEAEHILRKPDIMKAHKYFKNIEVLGLFHLATIAAVPFRQSSVFNGVLTFLESVDRILLKLPLLKWQAWQVVFVLSDPIK